MRLILVLLCFLMPTITAADPVAYALDKARSTATFTYVLDGKASKGTMPITNAQIILDADQLRNSRVSAQVETKTVKTPTAIVTQALRGKGFLNVEKYPHITFQSTKITGKLPKGKIFAILTIKGATRPVVLDAEMFHTDAKRDLSKIVIALTGDIDRFAFGMDGFPKLVEKTIGVEIRAYLSRQ